MTCLDRRRDLQAKDLVCPDSGISGLWFCLWPGAFHVNTQNYRTMLVGDSWVDLAASLQNPGLVVWLGVRGRDVPRGDARTYITHACPPIACRL